MIQNLDQSGTQNPVWVIVAFFNEIRKILEAMKAG